MALVEGVFSLFKIKTHLKKEKNKKHTYTIANTRKQQREGEKWHKNDKH